MKQHSQRYIQCVVIGFLVLTLVGCGRLDRWFAGVTGTAAETCIDGVIYLQFTSGATVKYTPDGRIATCR